MGTETGMSVEMLEQLPRIVSGEGRSVVRGREIFWEIKPSKGNDGRLHLSGWKPGSRIEWLGMTDNERVHLLGSLGSSIALIREFHNESLGGEKGIEDIILEKKIPAEVAETIRAALKNDDKKEMSDIFHFLEERIQEDGLLFRYIKP
jgi:hypothetical protein